MGLNLILLRIAKASNEPWTKKSYLTFMEVLMMSEMTKLVPDFWLKINDLIETPIYENETKMSKAKQNYAHLNEVNKK